MKLSCKKKKKLRLNLVKPLGPTTNLQELKTKEYVNTWGTGNHQIYIKQTIWFLQKIKFEGEEKRKWEEHGKRTYRVIKTSET